MTSYERVPTKIMVLGLSERNDDPDATHHKEKVIVVDPINNEMLLGLELRNGTIEYSSDRFIMAFTGKEDIIHEIDNPLLYTSYNYQELGAMVGEEIITGFRQYCKQQWDTYASSLVAKAAEVKRLILEAQVSMGKVLGLQAAINQASIPSGSDEGKIADRWERRWLPEDVSRYSRSLTGWQRILDEVVLKDVPAEKLRAPTLDSLALNYLEDIGELI